MATIPNRELRESDVPKTLRGWQPFALTFDGYAFHGSLARCAQIANRRNPKTLTDYRTCLFFEQRRRRHFGSGPDEKTKAYLRSLLAGIRQKLSRR